MAQTAPLLSLVRKYFEADPQSAAQSLETMERDGAVAVLKDLPPALCAKVFPHLHIEHAATLMAEVESDHFSEIVGRLDPHQGATLMKSLPAEARGRLFESLPERTRLAIRELLEYPENSAGRIMTTDSLLAFHTGVQVKDAIAKIRGLVRKNAPINYAYAVDAENRLVGVINMRDLMLASGDAKLEEIMRREVFAIEGFTDGEEVARQLAQQNYMAAPVIDSERRLLGIVKSEELIDHVQQEATEDLQKMFGAGGTERVFSPIIFSLKKRLPWLHINLATAFLAAAVIGLFEGLIAKITVLAVFLPVVAGEGGNAGAQSLAVVMRGLVMREIPPHKVKHLVFKEAKLAVANGLVVGIVTGIATWLWKGNPFLGVVLALAMLANLVAAGLAGTLIPITMKALGFDPAQSSNIVLTTVTDVAGFFSFLGFALLFQHLLL